MLEAEIRAVVVVTPEPPLSPRGGHAPPPVTAQKNGEKQRFLLFARMLMRNLERSDTHMHAAARAKAYECFAKNNTIALLKAQLRATVGERHWRKAHDDLDQFLIVKDDLDRLKQKTTLEPWRGDGAPMPPRQQLDPTNAAEARTRARSRHLLLLRHVTKCAAEDGRCTVPECAESKVLWNHLTGCMDLKCKVPLCLASRSLLNHYGRCQGPCNVCDPVDVVIRNEVGPKTKRPRLTPPSLSPSQPVSSAGANLPLAKAGGCGRGGADVRDSSTNESSPLVGCMNASKAKDIQEVASPAISRSCSKKTPAANGRMTSTATRRLPPKKRSVSYDFFTD